MEFLVPLMPLLGTLPIAVAAVLIARMWFRHRELRGELAQRVGKLEAQVEVLRTTHAELAERIDFGERVLSQVKEGHRLNP
jgi:uncharacterized membrane protein YciS (DUF1049 family)